MLRHVLSGLRPGAVSGTNTWTNTYNANGMRTKRTDGTSTYEYIYNGDKLVQMKKNGEVLNFTYVGNMPATMTYQGNTFYYVVNAQGDVTGITNSEGKLQVSYTYDAWGRWIYYRHDAAWSDTLGGINPLLYRGYVYDHETQLYYLQSRYYDMNTHRFLNADAFAATGQGLLGNNMFAYCGNNPVCRFDHSGFWWDEFLADVEEWLEGQKQKAENRINETRTYGVNVSGAFAVAGSVSVGLTHDRKGNVGIAVTYAGGGGFPSLGIAGFASANNAPTIYDQEGLGAQIGGSYSWLANVGAEYNILRDAKANKAYHGLTITIGGGVSILPIEIHGEVGKTRVWGINIYDTALEIVNWLSQE